MVAMPLRSSNPLSSSLSFLVLYHSVSGSRMYYSFYLCIGHYYTLYYYYTVINHMMNNELIINYICLLAILFFFILLLLLCHIIIIYIYNNHTEVVHTHQSSSSPPSNTTIIIQLNIIINIFFDSASLGRRTPLRAHKGLLLFQCDVLRILLKRSSLNI